MEKSELPNDLVLREGGVWQGGCSAMVSMGLSYRGKWALMFAPSGTKANSAEYIEIAENARFPDCVEMCGKPPTCLPLIRADHRRIHRTRPVIIRSRIPLNSG